MVEGEDPSVAMLKLGKQLIALAWNMQLKYVQRNPKLMGIEYPIRGFAVSWKEVQPGTGTLYSMTDPWFPEERK